jgi:hypothetical protein
MILLPLLLLLTLLWPVLFLPFALLGPQLLSWSLLFLAFLLPLFLLPLLTSLESLLWLGSLLLLASPAVVGVRLCSSCLFAVGLAVDVFLPQLLLL